MGYFVEISFNLSKHKNYTSIKNLIMEHAEKNSSISSYDFFELEGGKQIKRNRCIFSVYFDNMEHCTSFAKQIRRLKCLDIEIIYNDCNKIIFASSYYRQNKMTKESRDLYKKQTYKAHEQNLKTILQR